MNRVDRSRGVQLVTDHPRFNTPNTPPPPPLNVALEDADFIPKGLRVWAGRSAVGDNFHVQGLVDAEGATYITCILAGRCETREVPNEDALDAFLHPFAYGFTLPL